MKNCVNCGKYMGGMLIAETVVVCKPCEPQYFGRELDPINPAHYQTDKFQVIDIIEEFKLDYHLGNVIKYVLRAGKKGDKIEDLKKARWYLDRVINK